MKRIISLLLVLIMMLSFTSVAFAGQQCETTRVVDGYRYETKQHM